MSQQSLDRVLQHCRSLPGVTEDVKWGKDLVFEKLSKLRARLGLG